ncbi:hypothetical protein P3X46_015821 [Hevea brasiliensis]|uniref:Vitamin K epoxide reductase domain-containing protein n=1 Tax=Hevea brasiliensis TaxID=3981 RepID=A0ABQ9LX61_HEVBR|nr:thiol-disulfide oxidoreductase LTO1 isoform X2 [Hevea brasiliensis]KAJ9172604.1 hypothetical protein P3X46_015821 [Hevea brasiliensis]
MASFLNISSPPFLCGSSPLPSLPPRSITPITQFKVWCRGLTVKCMSSGPSQDAESESETAASSSSSSSSFSSSSISTYNWCAALGGIGFLETVYLTYLKLTDSDAFCPVGGGSCGDVLNSDYAIVFGVPLPVFGIVAYGFVSALGLQLKGNNLPFGIGESNGRLLLLAITTSMATASGYFLYILSTKFSGASCSYCLMSAFLSLSLFFITIKDFGLQEIQKVLGLQLSIAILVIAALSTSYGTSPSVSSSLAEIDLPYFTSEITTPSSPFAVSLAKHLHSIGAKMYGAFWCSHCLEQKQMFGKEALEMLDYVECFPDGYRKGTKIAKACADAKIEGFPTWVINGQVLSGEQELSELAQLSGFEFIESSQPT